MEAVYGALAEPEVPALADPEPEPEVPAVAEPETLPQCEVPSVPEIPAVSGALTVAAVVAV